MRPSVVRRPVIGCILAIDMNRLLRVSYLIIMLVLSAAAMRMAGQEVFHRQVDQVCFVPKGAWVGGVSVGYSQSDQKKYQFLVIENLNGDTYSFKLSPTVMYCFKDNLTIGGRFSYNRQRTRLESADIVLGEGTSYGVDHLYSISHQYYGTVVFRNYLSLGRNTRFGLFNEVQMQIGGGQSKICTGVGNALTGTYERMVNVNVGLAPGLSVFLSNYSAIEVNVGVLGFGYNYTKSYTDQIYIAHRRTKSANFNVNLFSITFGVMFYI